MPGKSHGQRSLAGYSPWGYKRAGHDLETKWQQWQNCGLKMTLDHQYKLPYNLYHLIKEPVTLALFYLRKPSKCVGTQSKNLIHLKHFLFKKLFFLIALPKWSVTLLRKNIFSNKTIPNRFLAKPVGHIVYRTDAPWFSAAKISVKSKFIFIVTSKLANISRIFFFFPSKRI